ncbi:MAG: 4-hydroxy-tetrahydrodipicolinate synthase [Bacillota bacterium]
MLEQILWTATVTPFTADGSAVDYPSLENCLRRQEKSGNGIVLMGSTGEGLSFTNKERREIAEFACGLNLQTQLVIGVPSHNFYSALEWLDFCNSLPIQGYLLTTPIYTKPGVMGQTHWYEAMLDKAAHPAILYNIPGRAAVRLHPEAVRNLRGHERFEAIKDSSGVVDSIVEYKTVAPEIAVYCGDDYMMSATAAEGSCGLISVIANAWPEATRRYVKHCLKGGKIPSRIWWHACKAMFTASNPIPVKALMQDMGIITSDTVRLPLSMEDLPSRLPLMEYRDRIENWEAAGEL